MARVGRLVGGGFAALLIAPWLGGVVAHAASSTPPPSGDDRATSYSGNIVEQDDNKCPVPGLENDLTYPGSGIGGFTITTDAAKQNLTVSAVPTGLQIDAFVVKGGDGYNVYPSGVFSSDLPVSGLHAPLVGNPPTIVPTISHWFLCYGTADEQPPPDVTPPSATITGDCDSAEATLNAGSEATVFTVTRGGDLAGTDYPIDANGSLGVPLALDSTHSTVTVTANGQTLKTFSRDNAVCDRGSGGGGDDGNGNGGGGDQGGSGGNGAGGGSTGATVTNPATSASDACKSGITVTLSNLGATVPVTFTLTAPDGSVSTATVGANKSTTRSFAVTEDSTGTVTVAAPGLTTKTFSYHKNCVTVLGVKHVRHHHRSNRGERTKVLGNQASAAQLPFTGFNARGGLVDAGLTIGLGLALCMVAARRREPAPARRRR